MHIHDLTIENFRGIKSLAVSFGPGLSAIVGPGDHGKTTILDAIALLFHPHWALNLSDNDFYGGGEPTGPILIRATVANPPKALTGDRTFFTHLRGIDSSTGKIVDEPDAHVPALTCELRVDTDFEPVWKVVCDRHAEGLALSANNRRRFGVRRIDSSSPHLKWVPHSALHQLSEQSDGTSSDTVLREASRQARSTARDELKPFSHAIESVTGQARELRGIADKAELSAELDADLAALTRGSISLHVGNLPVSRSGLGSRRLVSVAVQALAEAGAEVLLVDEVEAGLEPHRTRHLIRFLQEMSDSGRQVMLTTHSVTVLRELDGTQLRVTRRDSAGKVTLRTPPPTSQGAVRAHAEAFLAPQVLVCEGATEVGFARELCNQLEASDPRRLSLMAPVDARGEGNIVDTATAFHDLGYSVAAFCDFDTNTDFPLPDGVTLLRCDEGLALEQQVLNGLTSAGVAEVLAYGVEEKGRDSVESRLTTAGIPGQTARALIDGSFDGDASCHGPHVALAAKKGEWFKSTARGEDLARIALDPNFTRTTPQLTGFLALLRDWCAPQ